MFHKKCPTQDNIVSASGNFFQYRAQLEDVILCELLQKQSFSFWPDLPFSATREGQLPHLRIYTHPLPPTGPYHFEHKTFVTFRKFLLYKW